MIWIKNPKKIDKLPTDLLTVIFSYLNIEDIDILTARIVCTSFNGILSLELSYFSRLLNIKLKIIIINSIKSKFIYFEFILYNKYRY